MAAGCLRALLDAGHEVAIVVSQPDRRRGRGAATTPSPVKAAALEAGIPVTEQVDDVLGRDLELGVVVAFGRIIKPHVLAALPMVNLHFSLLPRWRGAAPVERAILAGDRETGVCVMEVEEGLDTGGVYRREATPIGSEETAAELTDRLGVIGERLLVGVLADGLGEPEPQTGEPTYAAKLAPAELALRWDADAEQLHRVVRVGSAHTTFRGARLIVEQARVVSDGPGPGRLQGAVVGCGDGRGLELVRVKPAGKPAMDAAAWLNGARPQPDDVLGA